MKMRVKKFRFIFKDGNFFAKRYMTLDELLDSNFALEQMEESINSESNIFDIEDYPDYEVFKDEYTELKDKNDIEIYEGDIILWHGGALKHIPIYSEVKWNREEARFSFGCKANSAYMFYNTEVVGNIYENPDLLKG